jgi:hypothetical protein
MDKKVDRFLVNLLSDLLGRNSSAFYWLHQYWDEASDPRTRNYLLVNPSLVTMSTLMVIYMLLVVIIIPAFMKNRKPFNLKKAIISYDVLMVKKTNFFLIV